MPRTPAQRAARGRDVPPQDRRFAVLDRQRIGRGDDPYIDRFWLVKTPWFAVMTHRIHRRDIEDFGHDHPWAWFVSVLWSWTGWYDETVWPDKTDPGRSFRRHRRLGSCRLIRQRAAHKITAVGGTVRTLVITGPKRGSWGFWPGGKFVPWREYLGLDQPAAAAAPRGTCPSCGSPHTEHERGLLFCGACGSTTTDAGVRL